MLPKRLGNLLLASYSPVLACYSPVLASFLAYSLSVFMFFSYNRYSNFFACFLAVFLARFLHFVCLLSHLLTVEHFCKSVCSFRVFLVARVLSIYFHFLMFSYTFVSYLLLVYLLVPLIKCIVAIKLSYLISRLHMWCNVVNYFLACLDVHILANCLITFSLLCFVRFCLFTWFFS